MKAFNLFFKASILLMFVFSFESCNHKPDYRSFLIKVDSIHIPDTLTANSPFDIDFFGTIGVDGCHSFSDFNIQQDNTDLLIEVWGKLDLKAAACPTVMVYLTGQTITCTFPDAGNYNIKIKQPDNTFLVKPITIN
jgi:hypothetical protein